MNPMCDHAVSMIVSVFSLIVSAVARCDVHPNPNAPTQKYACAPAHAFVDARENATASACMRLRTSKWSTSNMPNRDMTHQNDP